MAALSNLPLGAWVPWLYFTLLALYVIHFGKLPAIHAWQKFADSFESKGAQLLLLWVTDGVVLFVIVLFWKRFDPQLQTTIVGLLSGINGAFLGAVGSRQTSTPTNDGSQPTPPAPTNPEIVPFGETNGKA